MKKLPEKKRVKGFSNDFADIEPDEVQNAIAAQQAFDDLSAEFSEYFGFVIVEINKLIDLETKSSKYRDQIFRDNISKLAGIVVSLTRDLNETHKIRESRTNEIDLNPNYDPADEIERLKIRFVNVSHQVDDVIAIYERVDKTKAKQFTAQSDTRLNNILKMFVTFIDKLKAAFGFSDSVKRGVISGITKDLKAARGKHHKDINLGNLGL